jgi:hypothetical protein
MWKLISLLSTLALFVVAFTAVYISFRTSTQVIRGAVGGGFFFFTSLLLLWNEWPSKVSKDATVDTSDGLSKNRRDSCIANRNQVS